MIKFEITIDVTYRRKLTVYASEEIAAKEKAIDIATRWENVREVDAVEAEEVE